MARREEKKTAVALEYEAGDKAPKVIATGQGVLAETELYSIVAEILVYVDGMDRIQGKLKDRKK